MPQWGNRKASSNTVIFAPGLVKQHVSVANANTLYANTTVVRGRATGVVGITPADQANVSSDNRNSQHAGWSLRRAGTGGVTGITVSVGGTGYNNTDVISVTSGTVNATATLSTNATGGIVTTTLTAPGAGFVLVNPAATIANSTGGVTAGSGVTLVATAGGRAGRVLYESLVAMGSLT